jgi:hypothetical protein
MRKFVAGEFGVTLTDFEAARRGDRRKAAQNARAWRD